MIPFLEPLLLQLRRVKQTGAQRTEKFPSCAPTDPQENSESALRRNGYLPEEEWIPAKGFFALYLSETKSDGSALKLYNNGCAIATVQRKGGTILVNRTVRAPDWWEPRAAGMSAQMLLSYERTRRQNQKTVYSRCANLIEKRNPSPQKAWLAVSRCPWMPAYTKSMRRFMARFKKTENNPNAPRYVEACNDTSLPASLRKENWYRRQPAISL